MARWLNQSDVAIPPVDYKGALDTAIRGYQFGEQVKGGMDRRKLGELQAAIPESVTTTERVDSPQSRMLAEQTADFADESVAAQPYGARGIPEEAAAQESAKRQKSVTTKDWQSWEDAIRKQAGSMGPEALAEAEEHINRTQMSAFQKSAGRAANALELGDARAAKAALEEAYSNLPDGNAAEVDVTTGPDGKLVLVANVYDEDTGEQLSSSPVTAEDIGNFVTQLADPQAWSSAVKEGRAATEKAAEDARKFNVTEGRLSKADTDDMSVAQRKAAIDEGRAAVEKIRSGVQNKETKAKIDQIIANMEEVVNSSERADSKLALDQQANVQGGAQRELDRQKTRAEIDKLKADAAYTRGGKGGKGEVEIMSMKHKDLVKAITDIQETVQEAKFLAADEDATDTDKQAYQNLLTLQERLYKEEARRKGAQAIPVSTTTAVPPAGIPSVAPAGGPVIGQTATNRATNETLEWNGTDWVPLQ